MSLFAQGVSLIKGRELDTKFSIKGMHASQGIVTTLPVRGNLVPTEIDRETITFGPCTYLESM
jgi:hypothetical protein